MLNLLASDKRFYVVRKVEVEGSRPRRAVGAVAGLGGAGLEGGDGMDGEGKIVKADPLPVLRSPETRMTCCVSLRCENGRELRRL